MTTAPRPIGFPQLPPTIIKILRASAQQRSVEQLQELSNYYRSIDSEVQRIEEELGQTGKQAVDSRLAGIQDLVWALINSPAFLFNR